MINTYVVTIRGQKVLAWGHSTKEVEDKWKQFVYEMTHKRVGAKAKLVAKNKVLNEYDGVK